MERRSQFGWKRNTLRFDVILSHHQHSFISLIAASFLLAAVDDAAAQADETQALEEVQSELRALESRLESQREERDASSRALRAAELETANAAGALRDIRAQLAEQRSRQQTLTGEMRQANARLDGERDALTQQIRMSYIAGRQEGVKLLLNQDTPARLGRMVVYYDYLNRARSTRLDAVQTEIATLQNLEAESVQLGENLASLEASQAATVTRLESSRDQRRSVLTGLEEDIDSSGTAIARLREEAQRLGDLISEIRNARISLPTDADVGFASVAGELDWPVAGSLLNDFGQQRAGGELRWNGVVIGAPAGTSVRAVYHGRVAYADWLPGLGLLIIVEHGGGYMSLYGHNEAILKASGDWVKPGETIAHVGDSGGQSETAVYFEIRRDGEPIDPRPWMARDVN
ncbi:MAG: murein hydrolase activator EnvC family protein [Candidatus Rariloculaceae bacterium]